MKLLLLLGISSQNYEDVDMMKQWVFYNVEMAKKVSTLRKSIRRGELMERRSHSLLLSSSQACLHARSEIRVTCGSKQVWGCHNVLWQLKKGTSLNWMRADRSHCFQVVVRLLGSLKIGVQHPWFGFNSETELLSDFRGSSPSPLSYAVCKSSSSSAPQSLFFPG